MRNIKGRKLLAVILLAVLALVLAPFALADTVSLEIRPLSLDGGTTFLLPVSSMEATLPRSTLASAELMRTAPVMTVPEAEGSHTGYISDIDGMFCPDLTVTRAELARFLSGLTADTPKTVSYFYDVSWDFSEAQKAVGLGLMTAPNGFFRPNEPATRADLAYALSMMLPYSADEYYDFPDVPDTYWAYEAIARGGAYGLFAGDSNGYFNPENPVTRAELVTVMNRLLGRSGAEDFASGLPGFHFFDDVPVGHWAYWDILEATVPHSCQTGSGGAEHWLWADLKVLQDGPVRTNGRLYWVRDGAFVREESIGYLYFDANGRYTTGSTYVDTRVNQIIEQLTNNGMTRDQKLRALFNYCRDYYTYLKRPLISKGQTGWEPDYAAFFLSYGKGNCYCFSAAYCLMCRNLGLQAYTVVGSALNSPHGWVEIKLDGTVYLFDTQLEWRYLHDWGRQGYNFFKQPIYSTTVAYTR